MFFLRTILFAACLSLTCVAAVGAQPTPVGLSVKSLAKTKWQGAEERPAPARITLELGEEGAAILSSPRGTQHGKFDVDGDTLTLSFGGGNIVYTGKIRGDQLAGEAMDTSFKSWKFSLTREGTVALLPKTEISAKTPAPKGPVARMTPERLPDFLRKAGYKIEVVEREIGGPMCLVSLSKDGWTFEIEATVKSNGVIWLTAPLVEISRDKAGGKLLDLLEANSTLGPCFFAYRSADSQLCLRLESAGTTEVDIRSDLNLLTDDIRNTHRLWREENWK